MRFWVWTDPQPRPGVSVGLKKIRLENFQWAYYVSCQWHKATLLVEPIQPKYNSSAYSPIVALYSYWQQPLVTKLPRSESQRAMSCLKPRLLKNTSACSAVVQCLAAVHRSLQSVQSLACRYAEGSRDSRRDTADPNINHKLNPNDPESVV